ncbi:MAG: cytochrome c [Gammaproteobacteria bacterium]|nr:cytochrome c [Gammaproteobacteria bacterium]MCW8923961.1 cytochrome c [Gammaproteobacteria bacterium]
MKIFSINTAVLATGFALVTVCPPLLAENNAEPVEPLALFAIMEEMGKNMQTITAAIASEDWETVEETSPLIADHPQPPLGEKIRILTFIGTDVSAFKGHDGQTHQAAQQLGQAAASKDGEAVIVAFADLQRSCLSCHQRFRKSFRTHFYGRQ